MNLKEFYAKYREVNPGTAIKTLELQAEKRRDIALLPFHEMLKIQFRPSECPVCNYATAILTTESIPYSYCNNCPLPGTNGRRCIEDFINPFDILVSEGDLSKIKEFCNRSSQELMDEAERLRKESNE